jgi:hypothetical protein
LLLFREYASSAGTELQAKETFPLPYISVLPEEIKKE